MRISLHLTSTPSYLSCVPLYLICIPVYPICIPLYCLICIPLNLICIPLYYLICIPLHLICIQVVEDGLDGGLVIWGQDGKRTVPWGGRMCLSEMDSIPTMYDEWVRVHLEFEEFNQGPQVGVTFLYVICMLPTNPFIPANSPMWTGERIISLTATTNCFRVVTNKPFFWYSRLRLQQHNSNI